MMIFQYLPMLLSSVKITFMLCISALGVGLLFAFLWTFFLESGVFLLKKFASLLIFFIRGTPLLVQIFLIYYGSGQFDFITQSFAWDFLKHPFNCAMLALALNTSAYTAVMIVGAIRSVPRGEIEVGMTLGMSKWQLYKSIILPRAFFIALPAYSNEVIMILKGTSLASTITLMDIMGTTKYLMNITFEIIPCLLAAAFLYLLLNGLFIGLFRLLEKRAKYLTLLA